MYVNVRQTLRLYFEYVTSIHIFIKAIKLSKNLSVFDFHHEGSREQLYFFLVQEQEHG